MTLTFVIMLSKIAKAPTTHPIQFKLSSLNVLWLQNGPKNRFLPTFGLIMTSEFYEFKILSIHLCPEMHQSCKFDEIPQSDICHVCKLSGGNHG